MFVDRMQVLINMMKFTTAAVGITLLVTGGGVLFRDLKNNTPPPVTMCQGLWNIAGICSQDSCDSANHSKIERKHVF
jgi:hypothetical protein